MIPTYRIIPTYTRQVDDVINNHVRLDNDILPNSVDIATVSFRLIVRCIDLMP